MKHLLGLLSISLLFSTPVLTAEDTVTVRTTDDKTFTCDKVLLRLCNKLDNQLNATEIIPLSCTAHEYNLLFSLLAFISKKNAAKAQETFGNYSLEDQCKTARIAYDFGTFSLFSLISKQIAEKLITSKTIKTFKHDPTSITRTLILLPAEIAHAVNKHIKNSLPALGWLLNKLFKEPKNVATLRGHRDIVEAIQVNQENNTLISVAFDGTVKTWDLSSSVCLKSLKLAATGQYHLISSAGKFLISILRQRIDIYKIPEGKYFYSIKFDKAITASACLSPQERFIAIPTRNNSLFIWDLVTHMPIHNLIDSGSRLQSICFNNNGSILATCAVDNNIKLWDLNTGQCSTAFYHEDQDSIVNAIQFSPNGKLLVTSSPRTVCIWDTASNTLLYKLQPENPESSWLTMPTFSNNSNLLALVSSQAITIFDTNLGKYSCTIALEGFKANKPCFNSQDSLLIVGVGDPLAAEYHIKFFDIYSGTCLYSQEIHKEITYVVLPNNRQVPPGCKLIYQTPNMLYIIAPDSLIHCWQIWHESFDRLSLEQLLLIAAIHKQVKNQSPFKLNHQSTLYTYYQSLDESIKNILEHYILF